MTKAWGFAVYTILQMAASFMGSASPLAFSEMVRKDTGPAGGKAKAGGVQKRRMKNSSKKKGGQKVRQRTELEVGKEDENTHNWGKENEEREADVDREGKVDNNNNNNTKKGKDKEEDKAKERAKRGKKDHSRSACSFKAVKVGMRMWKKGVMRVVKEANNSEKL
jgi:hypothetical protein